jgi:hypothetical protein
MDVSGMMGKIVPETLLNPSFTSFETVTLQIAVVIGPVV